MKYFLFLMSALLLMTAQQNHAATPSPENSPAVGSTAERAQLLEERRASLRRMGDARFFDLNNPNVRSHDILAATALVGCGKPEWAEFMATKAAAGQNGEPTEIFALPPLVRYLYQYGKCLNDEQKKQILAALTKPQNLTGYGTTNQAIVTTSSWYLLAQYFPNAMWTDRDTHMFISSKHLMEATKKLLAGRTKGIYHYGHYELFSPNYAMINEYPLLNLIDFALDPEVKSNAADEALLEVALVRANSFHGVVVPPLTRKNFDQRNATDTPQNYEPSTVQQMLWYYYGEPAGLGLYDFRSGLGTFFVSMLGISSWLPPDPVMELNPASSTASHTIKVVTPRFGVWGAVTAPEIYGDSLITDDFAIGTGNLLFDPNGYSGHIQTFSILLRSDRPHNEIECRHPFWHSTAGEDAWLTDRSSPFQQMYRYDDSSVVMLFDIPKTDPWKAAPGNRFWSDRSANQDALLQVVTCRFARDFDEIIEEPNWVFVRQGQSFAAMATLHGANEYDTAKGDLAKRYRVVKIREPKTALFFRVDHQSAKLSFDQFRNTVRQRVPKYDVQHSLATFVEQDGTHTEVKFELGKPASGDTFWSALPRVTRNNLVQDHASPYVVQSPQLTLRDGILNIDAAGRSLTVSH